MFVLYHVCNCDVYDGPGDEKAELARLSKRPGSKSLHFEDLYCIFLKIIFEKEAAITAEAFNLIKMYVKNLRTSAWLKKIAFSCNTSAKL